MHGNKGRWFDRLTGFVDDQVVEFVEELVDKSFLTCYGKCATEDTSLLDDLFLGLKAKSFVFPFVHLRIFYTFILECQLQCLVDAPVKTILLDFFWRLIAEALDSD